MQESKVDVIKAKEMLNNGVTFTDVAKHFGVSKQRIHQMLGKQKLSCVVRGTKGMIYPNLKRWMIENEVTYKDLLERMGLSSCNVANTRLSKQLKKHEGEKESIGLRIDQIRKILEITGMSFEECFELEKGVVKW